MDFSYFLNQLVQWIGFN